MSSLVFILSLTPVAYPAEILVACASDLAPAQAALAESFQKLGSGKLKFVTGSSGMLARQISTGAPFDVFLSANVKYVEDLAASGAITRDSVIVYATGRLALWSRDGKVQRLEDLRRKAVRHIAIANPKHAPYGVAAQQLLEKSGMWAAVRDRIVYGENVRQALQFAESGNADVVLTAWSLLQGRGVLLPDNLHDPIEQAAGVVSRSRNAAEARRFVQFLRGSEGAAVLRQFGFSPR
ncbi:MAG: molybdate ABC transporter substrate-binding protein [Bryobacterales bacterium]|nr:molybdate ABC transporter substrate-binding protein [Bryobacterales bacterium]